MAGQSLDERVANLNRTDAQAEPNKAWLHKVYTEHKVRKKKIQIKKRAAPGTVALENDMVKEIVPRLYDFQS